jgi:undecaprenyl-diphosphatase
MDGINLAIVEWIQSFRTPFLDTFFLIITELGDETVFLVLAAILYWTLDKRFAYRFMLFFLYGAVINGSLKFITDVPRPYAASSTVQLVGSGSGGTSLPSGHAQNSSIMALVLHEKGKKVGTWLTPLLILLVILVMLSRLYLGEHYLSDVIFGLAISYAFYAFITRRFNGLQKPWLLWLPLLLLLPLAILTNDKNVFIASATIFGVSIGYPLEQKLIGFSTNNTFLQAIIKIMLGVGVALVLRIGIKAIFEMGLYSEAFDTDPNLLDHLLDFLRYFMVTMWMILGAPFIFKKVRFFYPKH